MESSAATPTITIPVAEYEQFSKTVERLNETVERQSQRIEQLISQLRVMQRARFGKSSERTLVGDSLDVQLDLFGSAELARNNPPETETVDKEHNRLGQISPGRAEDRTREGDQSGVQAHGLGM
jgi:uncharacterized coiled-coil protein SlyX